VNAAQALGVWSFRVAATVHALLLCAQPVLAGLFLAGDFGKLSIHATLAGLVILACMVQFVAAVLVWRPGMRSPWPIAITAAMFVAEGIQTGAGYERNLGLHVPLGVTVVATGVALAVWGWRRPRRSAGPAAPPPGLVSTPQGWTRIPEGWAATPRGWVQLPARPGPGTSEGEP
jgi:hypothetical protein